MKPTDAAIDDGVLRRVRLLRLNSFNAHKHPLRDRVRGVGVAVLLRVALSLGFVIVLIGRCRSGKSYLLQQFLAGRIIDRSDYWRESNERPLFNTAEVPNGLFAVDEVTAFEPRSLFDGVISLAKDGRKFVLTAQCSRDLDEANIGRALMGRRVLAVSLCNTGEHG